MVCSGAVPDLPKAFVQMPFYRCNICDVISKDLLQHNQHLEGRRHAKNVAIAMGEAPAPAARPAAAAAPADPQKAAKRQRREDREQRSVARAALLLDPSKVPPVPFLHRLLNLSWEALRAPQSPTPLPALPTAFPDADAYLSAWRPFIVEEARCAVREALEGAAPAPAFAATLRGWQVPGEVSQYVGLCDPCTLTFSMRSSGGGPALPGGGRWLQESCALLLKLDAAPDLPHPPETGAGAAAEGPPTRAGAAVRVLGLVSQGGSEFGDVEVKAVIPDAAAVASRFKGAVWSVTALCGLVSHQRMFDACLTPLAGPFAGDLLHGAPAALAADAARAAAPPGLNAAQSEAARRCLGAPGRLQLIQGLLAVALHTSLIVTVIGPPPPPASPSPITLTSAINPLTSTIALALTRALVHTLSSDLATSRGSAGIAHAGCKVLHISRLEAMVGVLGMWSGGALEGAGGADGAGRIG